MGRSTVAEWAKLILRTTRILWLKVLALSRDRKGSREPRCADCGQIDALK
jgi:hypothetical protein